MSTILDKAAEGIQHWNQAHQNSEATLQYFNQGVFFEFTPQQYEVWKGIYQTLSEEEQQNFEIHAYLCLNPNANKNLELSIYAVDSYTDSLEVSTHQNNYLKALQHIPYLNTLQHLNAANTSEQNNRRNSINPQEALERCMAWNLYKNTWIPTQTNLVRVFRIPFQDFTNLFELANATIAIAPLALQATNENGYEIELILWGQNQENAILWQYPEDFIEPCPPLCDSSFSLLEYANG